MLLVGLGCLPDAIGQHVDQTFIQLRQPMQHFGEMISVEHCAASRLLGMSTAGVLFEPRVRKQSGYLTAARGKDAAIRAFGADRRL